MSQFTDSRGGLSYHIETSGDFSSLDAFLSRLDTAKGRIEELKRNRVLTRGASDPASSSTTKKVDPEAFHRKEMARSQARRAALTKEGKESLTFFQRLRQELTSTDSQANRVSFTFRRLFGILAAFTVARQVTAMFSGMVREMVSFNARMETAELGIAQLISSLTEIRDPLGNVVGATDRFDAALREARKQMGLLRRDSLLTAATYEELVDTYQVISAPGLSAGLNLEEIRGLTLMISRAATALGVPQNQLAEEGRSLLQGTITPRNTRIATALGITNDQINAAKEAGQLFDFLTRRFSAFEESTEKTAQSFSALFSRLRGAVSLVLGAGGEALFERTRDLLNSLFDLLVSENPLTGLVEPAPNAVRAVKAIGDAFAGLVSEGQRLLKVFNIGELMVFGNAIASIVRNTTALIGGMIEGVIRGFNDIRSVLGGITTAIRSIPGMSSVMGDSAQSAVVQLTRLLTVYAALRVSASLLLAPLLSVGAGILTMARYARLELVPALIRTVAAIRAKAAAVRLLTASGLIAFIKTATISVLSLAAAFAKLAGAILLPITLLMSGKALAEEWKPLRDEIQRLGVFFGVMYEIARRSIEGIKDLISGLGQSSVNGFRRFQQVGRQAILGLLPEQGGGALNMFRQALELEIQETERLLEQGGKRAADKYAEGFGGIFEGVADVFSQVQDQFDEAVSRGDSESQGGFFSNLVNQFQSLYNSVSGVGEQITDQINQPLEAAETASQSVADVFREMPGLIAGAVRPLEQMEQVSDRLKDDLEQARNQLEQALMTQGMSGAAQQQVQALVQAEQQRVKLREDMQNQEITLRTNMQGLLSRQQRLTREAEQARASGDDWTEAVDQAVASYRQMTEEQAKASQIQSEIALLETQRQAALDGLNQQALPGINAKLEQQRKLLAEQESVVNQIIDGIAQQKSLTERQVERLREQVAVEGLSKIYGDQLNEVLTVRAGLEQRINDIRDARLRTILAETQEEERLALRRASLELQNTRQETAARTVTQRRRAEADIRVRNLQEELNLLGMTEAKELEALQVQMMATKDQELLNELQERYDAILARNNTKMQTLLILLAEAEKEQEKANNAAERPISTGIEDAAKRLKQEAPDSFQIVSDAMVATAEGMSQTISGSIADAFDPLTDGSILNRVSSFFSSIGRMIIEMTTQMLVFRAVSSFLSPAGAASGGSTTAIAQGAYKGGPTNTFAHAKGFARGGRPSGLHPTDTIPIWTAPGEWIIRAASVAKYGDAVMQRINAGLVDPLALSALAGVRKAASITTPSGVGRAMGGPVPTRSKPRQPAPAPQASGPSVAVIAPSDEAVRRLFNGGRNAVLEFLSDNGFQPA